MKIGGHFHCPMDPNFRRQIRIGPQYPGSSAASNRCIKMNNLLVAVNTGVGASRAVHPHRAISDRSKSQFQALLYGFYFEVGLRLPATVMTAIVFDSTGDS